MPRSRPGHLGSHVRQRILELIDPALIELRRLLDAEREEVRLRAVRDAWCGSEASGTP